MKPIRSYRPQSTLTSAFALALVSFFPGTASAATTEKFTLSSTWTCPVGVTSVTVEVWGGGGAGGGASKGATSGGTCGGGGGGGGAYARKVDIPVSPETVYTITIPPAAACPAGFTHGQTFDGASVTFTGDSGISVTASGGTGGASVVTTSGTTAVSGAGGSGGAAGTGLDGTFAGGNGATHSSGNAGAGGSGASDLGAGNNGSSSTAGATKAGSDVDHDGGKGATGKTGSGAGNTGATQPGGGGGGAKAATAGTSFIGSVGGRGQIILTYSAAVVPTVKANNELALNDAASWTDHVPTGTEVARWDNTVLAANTTVPGGDLTFGGIAILNPGGPVTIQPGNTLTVGSELIDLDLSAATADLTLNCDLAMNASNVWDIPAARTLTLGGIVSGNATVSLQGEGKTLLSGANTYSGNTTLGGGTLQLGASDVLPNGSGKGNLALAAGTTLELNGFSDAVNGLSGSGTVDNTAAGVASTLTVGGNNASSVYSGIIRNSGVDSTTHLAKTGSGQLTLAGTNTFTGSVSVTGGNLTLGTANPLGNISSLSIGGARIGCSANNAVIPAPVTLTGNLTVIVQSSGTLTSLNGAIGGTGNLTFATEDNTLNGDNRVSINAPATFTGNITITTTSLTALNNMTVRLGTDNALPPAAVVTIDGQNGNGTSWSDLNLNGFNQTLAGLTNVTRTSRLQRVYNDGAAAATLTIDNSAPYAFGGTLGRATGNNFGLTKSGTGTFTISGANSFTGETRVTAGILSLGNPLALRNSPLDTFASVAGDATNGLQTTVTSLTLGGLTGDKDLASVFETTAGGYASVTALTLNPQAGATPAYSAIIADGAPGMSLAKTGAGKQTLSGPNTYTGSTTITAGTLALGASDVLPATAISIGNATLSVGAGFSDTLGALDAAAPATLELGDGSALAFADSNGTWAGSLALTGDFESGSSLRFGTSAGGLSPAQLGQISATGFTGFTLDSNGYLVGTVAGGYSAWQSANGTTQAIDLDHDADGVPNGIEYFLGGGTGFTALPGVTAHSVTWLKGAGYTGAYGVDFVVETSTSLTGTWLPADPGTAAGQADITTNPGQVKYTFPAGTRRFARLKVTGP
jgi:fibronectin-binding autotransporter adhesin